MENIILAGFDGENNSSRIITENVKIAVSKVILPNDMTKSVGVLLSEIEKRNALCVIIIGQKPLIRDKIAVEPTARKNGEALNTRICCGSTVGLIKSLGYNAYISKGCGTSYCNNAYYECLENGMNCILLHIPATENISDTKALVRAIEGYIEGLAGIPALL